MLVLNAGLPGQRPAYAPVPRRADRPRARREPAGADHDGAGAAVPGWSRAAAGTSCLCRRWRARWRARHRSTRRRSSACAGSRSPLREDLRGTAWASPSCFPGSSATRGCSPTRAQAAARRHASPPDDVAARRRARRWSTTGPSSTSRHSAARGGGAAWVAPEPVPSLRRWGAVETSRRWRAGGASGGGGGGGGWIGLVRRAVRDAPSPQASSPRRASSSPPSLSRRVGGQHLVGKPRAVRADAGWPGCGRRPRRMGLLERDCSARCGWAR